MNLTHGSLYSGIGGWLLAARWAEIENIFTCEIDDFCNKILDKHFSDTDRHYDIKETNFKKYRGTIDILSTSDPCQPFSFAGKRGGTADDRFLWPQTIRVIREIRPSYVVFENVPGFISMAFETVASDLEAEEYTVESFIIPACGVGAWHRRDRLWIVAYSDSNGSNGGRKQNEGGIQEIPGNRPGNKSSDVPNTKITKCEQSGNTWTGRNGLADAHSIGNTWTTEPNVGRVANGIPSRVDRLKSLGNSIVPQIAYIIFEAIKNYSNFYDIDNIDIK